MALTPAETLFVQTHQLPVVSAMKPYLNDAREALLAGGPGNLTPPVITGSGAIGVAYNCTSGTWANSPTLTYQWRRTGVNISGATASTYTTVTADSGAQLTCAVTATNAFGSVTVVSNAITIATVDVTPPTVLSFSPADNAIGVATGVDLIATLGETVVLGTGVITLKKTSDNTTVKAWNVATDGGSVAGKVEVVGGTQLTMHLSAALANSTEVYVLWDANVVKDAANNPIAANAVTTLWSFTTVASSFTGLLDALGVSATRAYSTRKLASAYAGSAIRIRRSSDNAEQDIGFSGEDLNTAAITTFVGANSAYVVKMYDQSGNADDMVQATSANQSRIVNAGTLDVKNTKAVAYFDGNQKYYFTATNSGIKTLGFMCAVDSAIEAGPNWSSYRGTVSFKTTGIAALADSGAPGWYTLGGIASFSVNNGGNAAVFSGALQNVRGTDATGVASADPLQIGRNNVQTTTQAWPGWIGEVVTFATQLSAPNYATLYTNQKTYWGTP